jgi:hypothetical protein
MSYFFRINKPEEFRKSLLKEARDVILLLKSEEKIDDLLNKKKVLLKELKNMMVEINSLAHKLNEVILDTDLKLEFASGIDFIEEPKEDLYENHDLDKKPVTEVDRLEYTLSKIEEKLNRL